MTKELTNYGLNVLIAFVLLTVGAAFLNQVEHIWYRFAPQSMFYERYGMAAEDVCVGDTKQAIVSNRQVFGTEIGYPAEVSKELFCDSGDGYGKVYEERSFPIVEPVDEVTLPDGTKSYPAPRVQQLPDYLDVGECKWVIAIKLDINGAMRDVIPPTESNVFSVLPREMCNVETI